MPPPLPAVPVSAEARLRYVLQHFALAYPGAPAGAVGYAATQPQVEIADVGGEFFRDTEPYPAAPNWREWQGQPVPFFFDSSPEKPLLIFEENRVFISADIISAAFYLLSGWQEYFSTERDRHGRFPYAASVQQRYHFVTLPVVNYYFDVLRTAVEYVSGQVLHPRRWGRQQASFAAFISHDIDNMRSAWKAPAKAALKQKKLGQFGKLLWQHLTQPDAWDNLEAVAAATAQYGGRSTFFMLPSSQKAATGVANADYRLTQPLWRRLHQLQQAGCELALHGSIGTALDANKLRFENEGELQRSASGLRFHYLSWEPTQTLAVVDAVGFDYDSTLGFAEHFGFRNSYCQPFYPFNFATGQETSFLEIPLVLMDATLWHPTYLQLPANEIIPALLPLFTEIKKFAGVVSVLWHNENFDPDNIRNGPRQFHEIMECLRQQGAAFLTGREIFQEFTADPTPANS